MDVSPPDDDDFTKSEDLLQSITYGIRKFYFSGSWTDLVVGVVLEETEDSFLVALPVTVRIQDTLSLIEAITDLPYMRFIKSDVRAVTSCEGIHKRMYIEFLTINSTDIFPELLDMIGETVDSNTETPIETSNREMHEDMENLSMDHIEKESIQIKKSQEPPEVSGVIVKGNITDLELKNKVETAIKEGRFIPPTGKLPN
jgi:hypothetical protein